VYIDLITGEPVNMNPVTGEHFDGSARLAPAASPPSTHLESCAIPEAAARLTAGLQWRRYFVRLHSSRNLSSLAASQASILRELGCEGIAPDVGLPALLALGRMMCGARRMGGESVDW
jgi:hypothetical protein